MGVSHPSLNQGVQNSTLTYRFFSWDSGILALAAARHSTVVSNTTTRDTLASVAMPSLLHPLFDFDDVGMPTGGTRVPRPYFPGSGSLLYAVGAIAGGWPGPYQKETMQCPQVKVGT